MRGELIHGSFHPEFGEIGIVVIVTRQKPARLHLRKPCIEVSLASLIGMVGVDEHEIETGISDFPRRFNRTLGDDFGSVSSELHRAHRALAKLVLLIL